MKKVLVLGKIHNAGIKYLKNLSYQVDEVSDQNNDYKNILNSYDALIVKMTKVDQEFIDLSKNLKIIARHGVGYNNVNLDVINKRKIPLFIIGDVNSTSVAEHTFGLIINIAKKINYYDAEVRSNNFEIRNSFNSNDLNKKNILIFGYGRIGKKIADICSFFNMNVFIYDKFLNLENLSKNIKIVKNIKENLNIYDFISLHIPFNDSEKALIDKTFLDKLKNDCAIINTSRGDLINEKDLINHLKENNNFYAGLDVFNPEPPSSDNELFKLNNTILTPHSAAYTEECLAEMSLHCAINIENFFKGKIDNTRLINKEIYS
ncbi:NAD(P)-dependent oxidoreductase [Candidatus Pelagibacter sp. HIMB1695]|uniref:NAD(P)-dependent oxidoreductase n=1 Tax=Candidatus Pelagibacter sp. HIMB1695 TaxID=3413364 RepID=UPI003F82CEE8